MTLASLNGMRFRARIGKHEMRVTFPGKAKNVW
jgi:hypothetical protein